MPMILTTEQVAELLGVTSRRVNQLAQEGIAVRTDPGKFDAAATVQNYIEKVSAKAESKRADLDAEYELARQRRASADLTELKMAKLRGELLPVEEVVFGWSTLLASVRLAVLAIGPRFSHEQGLSPEAAVALDAHLRRALTELSDDPLQFAADLDEEGSEEPSATAEAKVVGVD